MKEAAHLLPQRALVACSLFRLLRWSRDATSEVATALAQLATDETFEISPALDAFIAANASETRLQLALPLA
jgi:hypothetical protein